MSNIPIYRAKKISSDEYIIGQYIETEFSNEEYCDIEEQETIIKHCIIKDFRTVHDDYEYCNFDITEIDIATLAIHFPDMIDSQGNKIFASLQEDGKGGDKFIWDNETFIIWFDNQALKVNSTNKDNFECNCHDSLQEWFDYKSNLYDLKVIGIQE